MKKPRTWRITSRFSRNQSQVLPSFFVLLLNKRLLAAGLLSHHGDDDAVVAEVVHGLEYPVPEGGRAEAGHDGEIEADLADGAAERTAAHLTLELLQGGMKGSGSSRPGRSDGRRAALGLAG